MGHHSQNSPICTSAIVDRAMPASGGIIGVGKIAQQKLTNNAKSFADYIL